MCSDCCELLERFEAELGLHHGAPLSIFMYEIAGNDLLKDLNECICGANVDDIKFAIPTFADDVPLIALSKEIAAASQCCK